MTSNLQFVCFYFVLTTFTTIGYGEWHFVLWKQQEWFDPTLCWFLYCRRYCCNHWCWTGSIFSFLIGSAYTSSLTKILLLQVFCIFLFLGAASLFGTIISQINEIVASQTTISKDLDNILEAYFSIEPRRATSHFPSNRHYNSQVLNLESHIMLQGSQS